jgi:hypothetical protein
MTDLPLDLNLEPLAIKPGSPVYLISYSFVDTPVGREMVRTVKGTERQFGPQIRKQR